MSDLAPHGYVWSRYTANPVEHIADGSAAVQPICGAPLVPERQYIADKPSGLVPVCQRCQRKAARLKKS